LPVAAGQGIVRMTRSMQIAGSICSTCGRRIVFADEGQICVKCAIAVHLACHAQASCPVCGGALKKYAPREADPDSARFNSPDDRRSGPAVAILFVVLGLVVVMWLVFWEIARPQGY
jgi:hypothetical protein